MPEEEEEDREAMVLLLSRMKSNEKVDIERDRLVASWDECDQDVEVVRE